ncbi:methylated-DNA--[protein]-cysteine S-methyltransferase [Brevibacillus ruminantium]|uniref:Methylated-DNA--protein-cysteine methyltransferase n=1 Tax=Brevibacillus ruminantium TaxID=2950604 RepID=A0ABY4WHT4_9BACL|nr:methylated-DNA--[protein]-cysteine S-methyltransferase [Brevibacillus ruminantium]USG64196.1 methylated-DNA--[protein]-cysteine S-methyltransferase [Brevibacillus ruminantium]
MERRYYTSPLGKLEIAGDRKSIASIRFVGEGTGRHEVEAPDTEALHVETQKIEAPNSETLKVDSPDADLPVTDSVATDALQLCLQQLAEYFEGKRMSFELPLRHTGTEFQQEVWQQVQAIPYGQTASYQDIAAAVNREKAVRAVGTANGKNAWAIVVPCHRVIGRDGELRGYAWELWRKEWLLAHEQKYRQPQNVTLSLPG